MLTKLASIKCPNLRAFVLATCLNQKGTAKIFKGISKPTICILDVTTLWSSYIVYDLAVAWCMFYLYLLACDN